MKIKYIIITIALGIFVACISNFDTIDAKLEKIFDNNFYLLSSADNKDVEKDLMKFASENNIDLHIDYMDDLEAIALLETDSYLYDAVWLSNSVWLYMLNDVSVSDSKSININPVVFGIKKSKAEELGFTNKKIYNKDIIKEIKNGNLKYVMTSVTKTNTGLIAYLGFLNALAGSPELLTSKMLDNKELKENLVTLFSGVERVSGNDTFLEDMFLNSSSYDAVVATESSLIRINKELESGGSEPLYLIYPTDGVAINDSPFAYINNGQEKEDKFKLLQSYLLNEDTQKTLESYGKRTWYGGVNASADASAFKKSWGIDTTEYLIPLKYPSRSVMNDAISIYIDELRKPSVTAFCLDYSGSMSGRGISELEEAMSFILDHDRASSELIQFSSHDKIIVLPFSTDTIDIWKSEDGKQTYDLINKITKEEPFGSTNIYGCSIDALNELKKYDSKKYTKTVILMTDGNSNVGSFDNLRAAYSHYYDIPIYGIMFGSARERELKDIASLTNAKVFDGRSNLINAFKEVRSYN